MNEHKESYYQTKIIAWLKKTYPAAFVWKATAGPYSQGGIPDICAIIDGKFYGFEVKRPESGRLSCLQEQTIKKINAAGGIAAVVSYPADVQKIIEMSREEFHEEKNKPPETKRAQDLEEIPRPILQG